jgi:hypothetical protein
MNNFLETRKAFHPKLKFLRNKNNAFLKHNGPLMDEIKY